MKALIAIDGSSGSFEAIQRVCQILSPERDQVVIYCSPPAAGPTLFDRLVEQGQSALVEAIFAEALKQFPESWQASVQKIVGCEDPRTDIAKQAQQCQSNLIVVGSRGLGAASRLLLGSVSRRVVHTATMPVLVVNSSKKVSVNKGLRVLLACESLNTGRKMATVLGQFAWPSGTACEVLTVVPSVLGGAIPNWLRAPSRSPEVELLIRAWVEEEETQLANSKDEMAAICKLLPPGLHDISARVVQGHADSEIIDAASKRLSDFIVIGTKGSTAGARFFIGSTCESVLNRAPCSVLVIPHVLAQ